MTLTQKYFISILRSAIFGEEPELPGEDIDWKYLIEKGRDQNVQGLLADSVLRLPEQYLPTNASQWEKEMLNTIYTMGRRFGEFERMAEIISDGGYNVIALKGIVLKDMYPVPELRTMGDFDVLTDNMKEIRKVFESEGYSTNHEGVCMTASSEGVHWEIFESLESEFKQKKEYYNKLMMTDTVTFGSVRRPSDLSFCAHVIVHAAKHILGTGAGVRQICDCVLAINKLKPDMDTLRHICREQKVEKVYDYILACAARDFGQEIEYDKSIDIDLFWEYLLANGVFGKHLNGNTMMFQVGRGDDTVSTWRKMFFPPAELLSPTYNYAKSNKFLLPAAWVHRIVNAFVIRRDSVRLIAKGLDDVREFGREREEWLKKLELM